MTGSILDYLIVYGDVSFSEMRFTEVDAAILSKLSYFKFDGLVAPPEAGMPAVSLKNLMLLENHDQMFEGFGKYEGMNRELVNLMLKGKRFADLRIVGFSNTYDRETETQFAAVTFLTGPRRMCVMFRGTDSTLVGLKEDFNLLYMDQAPCHIYAMNYLKIMSERYARKLYVGGHSKGGHLAVYATMYMPEDIQERIHRVYSLDGLGLRPSVMEKGNFKCIENKIYKLVPESSLIGMMLDDDDHYEVVKSNGNKLAQHNVYSWEVNGNRFTRAEKIKNNAVFVEHSFNGWVDSQDDANRQKFIDGVFSVIDACQAETISDLTSSSSKRINQILGGIKDLDEETASQIKMVFKAFADVTKYYLKADVGGNIVESANRDKEIIISATKKETKNLVNTTKRSTRKLLDGTEKLKSGSLKVLGKLKRGSENEEQEN